MRTDLFQIFQFKFFISGLLILFSINKNVVSTSTVVQLHQQKYFISNLRCAKHGKNPSTSCPSVFSKRLLYKRICDPHKIIAQYNLSLIRDGANLDSSRKHFLPIVIYCKVDGLSSISHDNIIYVMWCCVHREINSEAGKIAK